MLFKIPLVRKSLFQTYGTAAIEMPTTANPPPAKTKQSNRRRHNNSVIHIRRIDWPMRREKQDYANKQHPKASNRVEELAPPAQGVRTGGKGRHGASAFVDAPRDDDGHVAEVEGRRCDVEDGVDGAPRADANEVEAGAEGDDEPHGVGGGRGVRVDSAQVSMVSFSEVFMGSV